MKLRNTPLNIRISYSSAKIDRKEFVSNAEHDNDPIKIKFYVILVKSYIVSSAKNRIYVYTIFFFFIHFTENIEISGTQI